MAKRWSESKMQRLWSKTVLAVHNHRCAFCGQPGDDNLECHHIIRRRKLLTRWDWKNGIALCHNCHKIAHEMSGQIKISMQHPYWEYLFECEYLISKDVFAKSGMTAADWYEMQAEEMAEVHAEHEGE